MRTKVVTDRQTEKVTCRCGCNTLKNRVKFQCSIGNFLSGPEKYREHGSIAPRKQAICQECNLDVTYFVRIPGF